MPFEWFLSPVSPSLSLSYVWLESKLHLFWLCRKRRVESQSHDPFFLSPFPSISHSLLSSLSLPLFHASSLTFLHTGKMMIGNEVKKRSIVRLRRMNEWMRKASGIFEWWPSTGDHHTHNTYTTPWLETPIPSFTLSFFHSFFLSLFLSSFSSFLSDTLDVFIHIFFNQEFFNEI